MKKRVIRFVVALLVIIGGLIWLHYRGAISSPPPQHGVVVSTWHSGIGAVSDSNMSFDKQKLSFQATIWNNTDHSAYVKAIQVKVPASLRNRILSGESVIPVQRTLKPNGATKVSGQFILNTKGMTKQQILNLGNIEGFVVQTGQ